VACVAGLFLSVEKSSELVVDTARGEVLQINVCFLVLNLNPFR
jgi:hypothetical protein